MGPGENATIADLAGPGRITHLWFTIGQDQDPLPANWSRLVQLRIYWDQETSPSVQVPLGYFFAQTRAAFQPINSAVVCAQGKDARGWSTWWPMPFRHRARMELLNPTTGTLDKVYYHIDWVRNAAVSAEDRYFHAQYRSGNPQRPGQGDYLLADIKGRGHYVGTVYSVETTSAGEEVFESDERFFVDGSSVPTSSGTGTEDYYGGAWGLQADPGLWSGLLLHPDGFTLYRWHVPDPMPFRTSLRISWENFGLVNNRFGEVIFCPSSVAFWYQWHSPLTGISTSEYSEPSRPAQVP